jgi:hypothetical protein
MLTESRRWVMRLTRTLTRHPPSENCLEVLCQLLDKLNDSGTGVIAQHMCDRLGQFRLEAGRLRYGSGISGETTGMPRTHSVLWRVAA